MEGDKVSDVNDAGGDQQEPEGRQQQQGLRPLRPWRPSKTWCGQVFRSYLLSRDDDDDDGDDYYRHDDDFGDYEQNLSLSSLFQPTEEPVSPSPRIGREVWSTDHEGSQIRWENYNCKLEV